MSTDLGLVVGRGIDSMSCTNNVVTVSYSDGTTGTFNINNNLSNMSLVESKTGKGLTVSVYSDGLYVFVKLSGTISQTFTDELAIVTGLDTDYTPPCHMYARCHSDGTKNITFRVTGGGAVSLYANGTTNTKPSMSGGVMYPLASRMP